MEENKQKRVLLFLNNCTTLVPIVEIDDPETDLAEATDDVIGFTESTVLVGDGIYNGIFFPAEELEKAFHTWDKQPINMNHSDDIKDEVGYITKPRYDTGTKQLRVTPILNKETSGYADANGYIQNRMKAGKPPEVSIGVWVDREYELMDDETERLTARNLQGDHLALVSRGACSPEAGCGIGLSKEEPIAYIDLDNNSNANVTIMFSDGEQKNNYVKMEELDLEEKTIEEMQAKIELLEKEKAQRQLNQLVKEAADAERLQLEAEKEKLREEIHAEVLEELGQKSQIVKDDKPATLQSEGGNKFQVFLGKWSKNHGIKQPQSYGDWVHDYCNKFGYMEKK